MNAEPIEQDHAEDAAPVKAPKPRSTRRAATAPVPDATAELPSASLAAPTVLHSAVPTATRDSLQEVEPAHVSESGAGHGTAEETGRRPEPAAGLTSPLRATDPRPAPVPTNVYRARRPAVAFLLVLPALAVGLLLVKGLAMAAFGQDGFALDGVLSSVFALVSLPLLVGGLYGLLTGAAHGAEHYGFRVWARPPLAYLLVGLALAITASIAIR